MTDYSGECADLLSGLPERQMDPKANLALQGCAWDVQPHARLLSCTYNRLRRYCIGTAEKHGGILHAQRLDGREGVGKCDNKATFSTPFVNRILRSAAYSRSKEE